MYKANDLLRQATVARMMGVTRSAVNQKIDAGFLECVEVGGIRFVPYREVVRWQEARVVRARKLAELL